MIMARKIVCIALVVILPFLLQANTGCTLDAEGIGGDADCQRPPERSNPNSYVCSCNCKPVMRHREVRVAAALDDAEQVIGTGAVTTAGLALNMGNDPIAQIVGCAS
jgi:hypothetical protein